jgi:hypothetical protein
MYNLKCRPPFLSFTQKAYFASLCFPATFMAAPLMPNSLWKEAFGEEECPSFCSSNKPAEKKNFAPLTSPKRFTKDLTTLSHTQIYALAKNSQLALKTAQDEYLHLERLIKSLDSKEPPSAPQALLDPDRFEEDKEAILYGYKRSSRGMPYTRTKDNADFYGFQEPFSQGGFVPTEAQYKRLKLNAKDANNIDGWTPVERGGKKMIPRVSRSPLRQRQRPFTDTLTRPSQKRRLVEQGLSDTDATATYSDSDAFDSPSKYATRFLGRKIPSTRDPSETPTPARDLSTPQRQHKFIMNKFTTELVSTRLSTHSSPAPRETSPTPSSNKRRRITTKQNHKPRFATSTNSPSSPLPNDPEDKKWTDAALISAINKDHSFLHPDPTTALSWKNAIINAPNPVRSYAMKRKWAWWREGGMDKRPRRSWREGTGEGDESQDNEVVPEDPTMMKSEEFNGPGLKREEADDENEEKEAAEQMKGELQSHHHQQPSLEETLKPPLSPPPPPPPPPRPHSQEPTASPPSKKKPAATTTTTAKKSALVAAAAASAKQQQKDRQYTFKLDHPPPPPAPAPAPPASTPVRPPAKSPPELPTPLL